MGQLQITLIPHQRSQTAGPQDLGLAKTRRLLMMDFWLRDSGECNTPYLLDLEFVSWNVGLQGYRDWSIRHELVTIVEQCCPSLIFLQDLKISLRDRKKVVRSCVVALYKVYFV